METTRYKKCRTRFSYELEPGKRKRTICDACGGRRAAGLKKRSEKQALPPTAKTNKGPHDALTDLKREANDAAQKTFYAQFNQRLILKSLDLEIYEWRN